jgi:hypothetical protein
MDSAVILDYLILAPMGSPISAERLTDGAESTKMDGTVLVRWFAFMAFALCSQALRLVCL